MTAENIKIGKSVQKYMRISPQKVRLVINLIKRKGTDAAATILKNNNRKAAKVILLGLKSAVANAKVLKMDEAKLFVSEAKADCGPTLKRFMTRSMGRADRMLRRTSHITVLVREGKKDVNEIKAAAKAEPKEVKTKAPKVKSEEKAVKLKAKTAEKKTTKTPAKDSAEKVKKTTTKKNTGAKK